MLVLAINKTFRKLRSHAQKLSLQQVLRKQLHLEKFK